MPSLHSSPILAQENWLFFKRWLQHPFQLGTFAPISLRLSRLAAQCIRYQKGENIVEIGAGTGRLTRALLEAGIPLDKLIAVELDQSMCSFLQKTTPDLLCIQGDACYLSDLIPKQLCGYVDKIVSAIPLMYLPPRAREKIIESCFDVLKPGGEIIHLTYHSRSPLHSLKINYQISSERIGALWLNFPPGFLWCYKKI